MLKMRYQVPNAVLVALMAACASSGSRPNIAELRRQVFDTERAFAHTMAARDFAAFTSFVSDEAVFLASDRTLYGKREVAEHWRRYFESREAPFSWEPARVEVLASGRLALSTGPVRDPGGKLVGTFTSIWRLEAPGIWRIIFDKGDAACGEP